jgi:hypothetical protein
MYCHVFIAPWIIIIMGFGLDVWIYWQLILQSLVFTINYKNTIFSRPFFLDCRGLAPFSFSFYDWLLIYDRTTYTVSRRIHIRSTRCPAMYANHIENTASSVAVFTARCIAREVIRSLLAYSLPRECLPSRCLATGMNSMKPIFTCDATYLHDSEKN